MDFRLGPVAVSFYVYPNNLGWGLHKWRYMHQTSWRHGTAYLWRLKIMW